MTRHRTEDTIFAAVSALGLAAIAAAATLIACDTLGLALGASMARAAAAGFMAGTAGYLLIARLLAEETSPLKTREL